MIRTIALALLSSFSLSLLTGCVVYRHPHHDDVVVEPAGYHVDHHDDHDEHWDHDHDWDHR